MKTKKKTEEIKESLEEETNIQEEHQCHCQEENEKCTCDNCECQNEIPIEEEMLILKNTVENLEEKVRYHQAELINYRKRKDEEVTSMLKYANQDLIVELLPLVDNFERAIKLSEKDEHTAKIVEGFNMLYNNLIQTLHKFGVEEIKSTNEKFDPKYHEALLIENDKNKEEDIILETLITGYLLKDRVIRPSSVKVNKLN